MLLRRSTLLLLSANVNNAEPTETFFPLLSTTAILCFYALQLRILTPNKSCIKTVHYVLAFCTHS